MQTNIHTYLSTYKNKKIRAQPTLRHRRLVLAFLLPSPCLPRLDPIATRIPGTHLAPAERLLVVPPLQAVLDRAGVFLTLGLAQLSHAVPLLCSCSRCGCLGVHGGRAGSLRCGWTAGWCWTPCVTVGCVDERAHRRWLRSSCWLLGGSLSRCGHGSLDLAVTAPNAERGRTPSSIDSDAPAHRAPRRTRPLTDAFRRTNTLTQTLQAKAAQGEDASAAACWPVGREARSPGATGYRPSLTLSAFVR